MQTPLFTTDMTLKPTANFDCVLRTSLLWETHHIMIAHVTDVVLDDNPSALLYGQRAYRRAVGLD